MPTQTRISPHPANLSKGHDLDEEKESHDHDEMSEPDPYEDLRTKIKCESGWLLDNKYFSNGMTTLTVSSENFR